MSGILVSLAKFQGLLSYSAEEFSITGNGCLATVMAILFILVCHCLKRAFFSYAYCKQVVEVSNPPAAGAVSDASRLRTSQIVSNDDLKLLIENLNENHDQNAKWENVIDRSKDLLSYNAKYCKPKDGPLKYMSVTVFENCSPEILRDFYMDGDYRKQWDKTLVEDQQLQVDEHTGTEIGRSIKKFPLLTPREYVLAWKLWEGNDKSFYCFIKECEHALAPYQKKYVRVGFYRSGWQIRKVPGRNASEIKMYYQEDSGMNVEMAKMAFSRGIWSYVCKMETALRKYPGSSNRPTSSPVVSATTLIQKVPTELDIVDTVNTSTSSRVFTEANEKKLSKTPSRKLLTNALILIGGAVCLSRGHSSLGAKVAMAYMLTKLRKHSSETSQQRQKKRVMCSDFRPKTKAKFIDKLN